MAVAARGLPARGYEKAQRVRASWAEKMEAKGYEKAQREMAGWAEKMEAKGRQEGRQEGEAALLARMVTQKFGPLSEGVRRMIETADAEQLLEWGERFVTAGSVEEVFDGKG